MRGGFEDRGCGNGIRVTITCFISLNFWESIKAFDSIDQSGQGIFGATTDLFAILSRAGSAIGIPTIGDASVDIVTGRDAVRFELKYHSQRRIIFV